MLLRLSRNALFALVAMTTQTARFGYDLNGKPVERLANPDTRAVVLVFAATDCPVSNRYIPEIGRLSREFADRNVRFWWAYPNPGDTAAVVQEHRRQFAMDGETILDSQQTLMQMAHAHATPEAAVFVPRGDRLEEVYHGRVDDRYISLGRERPAATRHDLEEALSAVLVGRRITTAVTEPVGCAIMPLTDKH